MGYGVRALAMNATFPPNILIRYPESVAPSSNTYQLVGFHKRKEEERRTVRRGACRTA